MVVLATVATIIAAKSVISGAFSVTRQAIQLGLVAARSLWHKPGWLVAVGGAVFLTAEVSFFLANLSKIAHGGWVPLLVAAVVFTILMTWKRGDSS